MTLDDRLNYLVTRLAQTSDLDEVLEIEAELRRTKPRHMELTDMAAEKLIKLAEPLFANLPDSWVPFSVIPGGKAN